MTTTAGEPKGTDPLSGYAIAVDALGRRIIETLRQGKEFEYGFLGVGLQTDRLGPAELLWSRVSREPYATVALRPGVVRPGVETSRPGVVRAGGWTDTGWPATMESAILSGRRAAQHILSSTSARVTA